MHYWGDEWFQKNGNDLNNAIDFIETYLTKHHIGVCGKEKYGTYRDEYLRFWSGGLYEILFGYSVYIGTWRFKNYPKLQSLINKIHHFIYYKVDCGTPEKRENESFEEYSTRFKNRKWKGLQHYSSQIGLTKLIQNHQAKHYNKAFQLACKKWPNVKEELIVMVDGYKMIKPCKWGEVDGEEIHNKYWKKL
jgi:hypothetical protein